MLIEVLRAAAQDAGSRPAVIAPGVRWTYSDLLDRSEALARGLAQREVDRFACRVDRVEELVALLCASTATGGEACAFPDTLDEHAVSEYAAALERDALIADRPWSIESATTLRIDQLAVADGDLPEPPPAAPVLILTTGTTGRPKAARHDWARLVAAVKRAPELTGTRWMLTYNLPQFAGLQVLLYVLVNQGTLVVPRSRRPSAVVEAAREFGVTHLSATPTFWRMLVAALDEADAAELPLEQITLGGEAVTGTLLRDLRRLFPTARLSQVYASTEFGSSVSVRDGRSGLPCSVLTRDEDTDVQFRIVDGELYARSKVGMSGYWGEEQGPGDGWLPTGDLVEQRGDRIYFVGRSSETINVGGVKVHPIAVEDRITTVGGVQLARAYGRPSPVTGEIVVLDVVARPGTDIEQLEQELRAACDSLAPAARPRRIRFVDEIEVRGQKIARLAPDSAA